MSRVAAVTVVAVLLAGCQHALTRVALPGESPPAGMVAASELHVGDEVRVVLRDGTIAGATIAVLQPDALVAANGTRYAFADMTRLELRKVAAGRSAMTAAALIAGAIRAPWLMARRGQAHQPNPLHGKSRPVAPPRWITAAGRVRMPPRRHR